MPKVPVYSNFQTQQTAQPNALLSAPSGPTPGQIGAEQAGQFGQALGRAASVAEQFQEQADQVRVADAVNKAMSARLRLTYDRQEGYIQLRGEAALKPDSDGKSLAETYGQRLSDTIDTLSGELGNDRQRLLFSTQSKQVRQQFEAGLFQHLAREHADYSIGVQQGTTKLAQDQMGLAWGDVGALVQSRSAIKAATAEEGRLRGWPAAMVEASTIEQLSRGHNAVVLGALQAGKVEYAAEYLNQVNPELTDEARLRLTGHVKDVHVQLRGDQAADEAWAAAAPKGPNDPVRIFDMEQALRNRFPADVKLREAALTSLKQRAAAFNAQQSEMNAGGINAVYGMVDSGMPMSRVKSSPAWLGLPEVKRHEIVKGLEAEAAARSAHGASELSRQVSQLQLLDRKAMLDNGADYMRDSDPDNLAAMSRTQVAALRTKYGFEGTERLLTRWQEVQSKDGRLTAKIDDNAFKGIVQEVLALDPYRSNMPPESKALLDNLKSRVDILLQKTAQDVRRPLTAEEKSQIMRQEAAKTVTVGGWWDTTKPAAALTPAEAAKVVVPAADKARLISQMQRVYTATSDPDYVPTEANLRRLYLKGISPIAGVPHAK